MNWLNGFELMCYIIVAIMLVDLIRKKDYNHLFTFGTAALDVNDGAVVQNAVKDMRASERKLLVVDTRRL